MLQQSRLGLIPALNAGLSRCRGRYIARIDADDLMHGQRLTLQRRALDDASGLDAVGSHVRIFPRADLRDGTRSYERWLNGMGSADDVARDCWIECPVAHPSLMLRRESIPGGAYRDAGWPEDYDLVLRMLTGGRRIGVVPRRLLSWRDTPRRLQRTDPRYAIGRFTACKTAFLAASFLSESDRYILWGYGATGRALRKALAAHGKTPAHIVEVHLGRLGNRIHGAPVVPPEALPELPRRPLVVSVAGADARGLIRSALRTMDFVETRDYVVTA